jgi:methyl-accepting chemotaxis protein
MRFTIKIKLAGAFGAVILLSTVTGAIGYMKLTDMGVEADGLISRAERIEKAAELRSAVLMQNRAEKNVLLSNSQAESERFVVELNNERTAALKTKDELYSGSTEEARQLLDRFAAGYGHMNSVQDETINIAKTDKAKAIEHSTTEGRKAMAEVVVVVQEYVRHIKKTMSDRAAAAREDSAHAQLLMMSLIVVLDRAQYQPRAWPGGRPGGCGGNRRSQPEDRCDQQRRGWRSHQVTE